MQSGDAFGQFEVVGATMEGTEAAAVTVAEMKVTSAAPPIQPFEMVVDRPFVFVIADNATKAILFVGVVYEPASAG